MRDHFIRTSSLFLMFTLFVGVSACESEPADLGAVGEIDFAPELEVNLANMTRTESGLLYLDEEEGEGEEARSGRGAMVHYTGWLPDGTQFDSSHSRGEPFILPLIGAGMVIEGWDEGLQGMRPGGTRLLVIPPDLAYGEMGAGGVVPPNATLVFRVELLDHVEMDF
jgi:FKBP-type peptidyl-prolyl cis-trans isomerase FkpA